MLPLCLPSPPIISFFLPPRIRLQTLTLSSSFSRYFLQPQAPNRIPASPPLRSSLSGETSAAPLRMEEIIERDWSFLDLDAVNSDEERLQKTHRIISAGGLRDGSRLLVCMGSEWFVDRLVDSVPAWELLLCIHESLFALAMIKEKHDKVRCWQGEITALPLRFSQFDAVLACYFPGMGVTLDELLSSVAGRCSPGGRLLISYDQGREVIEGSHRQQYPDMVSCVLPERSALEKAAANHSFQIIEFVDEPTFYLAVLTFNASGISSDYY